MKKWYDANQTSCYVILLITTVLYVAYWTTEPVGCLLENSCSCAVLRSQYVPLPFFLYYRRNPNTIYDKCQETYQLTGVEADERTCGSVCDPDYGVVRRMDCDVMLVELLGFPPTDAHKSIEEKFELRGKRMRSANMTFGTCINDTQRIYHTDLIQKDGYLFTTTEMFTMVPATIISWATLQAIGGLAFVTLAVMLIYNVERNLRKQAIAAATTQKKAIIKKKE